MSENGEGANFYDRHNPKPIISVLQLASSPPLFLNAGSLLITFTTFLLHRAHPLSQLHQWRIQKPGLKIRRINKEFIEKKEVLKNEHKLADKGEIHLLQDSGEVAKDQQEADNHGEIDLENSDLEVMKNEEESAHGEFDIPKTTLSQHIRCIHNIFMSRSYQIITKEELKYKIICYSLDMTQSREAEEVLEHLVNHVPEWISRKSFLGGDVFSINRTMDVESILTKIEQT